MGATTFITTAMGRTAEEAFGAARGTARYEHGHGGYTGTIAEKTCFAMLDVGREARAAKQALEANADERESCAGLIRDLDATGRHKALAVAEAMLVLEDRRIDDKWGPAGCLRVDAETWVFFGWASC